MKMEECDGLAAKWNFAPATCTDAQRNDRIAAPNSKTVVDYYWQRQHTSRCDGAPSSSRSLLAREARLHGRIEVTDSDSPPADSALPGALASLQRSRTLFPRPRCRTNFLVRCDGSTTAAGVSHEVSGHQALHRGCRPQDER